ncbi:hypothetical protein [Adhaeretor mobilis]|uniref:PEP-CTERM protein-sorting domain-containing protein n=1 Tax=Adhaeretor mobilis TaxID=1930276 RepID=A0A517MTF5_9BACT|nr:hypothetical protein [Adhaeretor mobilis]QDS98067.1 hypothetical protein HG15A2_13390 [Adhaeretor mobilis]
MKTRHSILIAVVLSISSTLLVHRSAHAALATFDTLTEGNQGATLTDGGINFYDPVFTSGGSTVFMAEQADATLSGPFFSPNNVLGQGGFAPGSGAGFPIIGAFKMNTGNVETSISVEWFTLVSPNTAGNSIHLDISLGGTVVGGTSMVLSGSGIQHHTLALSGTPFDEARIYGTGSFQNGAFPGLFDNIRIEAIPEPTSFAILAIGGIALFTTSHRKSRQQ